ncbi:hypothetical protein [Streptomyces pini]|uniref:Uncharacterized protein n=1 Tax=Streptomyces pini TaxID=1520580 RepID=A0A1I4CL78_9ACTN|nr:hypothetical protein [Streptomyces pini]SFK80999.1 hypothetical protein SAMN05192584_10917 [Streptomyces pini]
MTAVRAALGVVGGALLAVGGWLLLFATREGTPPRVAVWLAGAVLAHDLLLAPLVLLAGWALGRLPARPVWRGGLVVAGCLTLVALPVMLRPGPYHTSLLPLDYERSWLLAVSATALVTASIAAAGAAARRLRKKRP